MSSAAGPSSSPPSELFQRAALRIISSKGVEKNPCDVVLAVSHSIYWKADKGDAHSMPKSLFDFRNECSLALTRLSGTSTWKDVEETVKENDDAGAAVIVKGRLRGRARWTTFSGDVKLVLITKGEVDERNILMREIRLRVAPWELLHKRARELVVDVSEELSLQELTHRMNVLLVGEVSVHRVADIRNEASSSEEAESVANGSSRASSFQERMGKLDWVEKLNSHLSNLAGIIAKVAKKRAQDGGDNSNTAQAVEDVVKIIPGCASSVFHLLLLGARLCSMYAEASRGREELPGFLVKVGELLQCVTESVVPVLQSSYSDVEKGEIVLEANVFEVLVTIFDLTGSVEEQLLRSWRGQLFNAGIVKEVEAKLGTLKMKVVDVVIVKNVSRHTEDLRLHSEDIRKLDTKVSTLEKKVETPVLSRIVPSRPRKSSYFVGRAKELDQLKCIARDHGSAAITGYGGLGKSQLMTAFAERAEVEGDVPGGVFWVVADGYASQVVETFAVFVERLKSVTIPENDRQKPEVVLSALNNVLGGTGGRWLLCIDNVDRAGDSDVGGILDDVPLWLIPEEVMVGCW